MNPKVMTGFRLKLIAMVSMFIDHTAAILLLPMLNAPADFSSAALARWVAANWQLLANVYYAMRYIGRFAFPIYCFLLTEGFRHTRSVCGYAARLGLFCLLSEIPFDLAFQGCVLEFSSNNVFFTLLAGLLSIWAADTVRNFLRSRLNGAAGAAAQAVCMGAVCAAFWAIAEYLLRSDYGGAGVLAVFLMYLLSRHPALGFLAGTGALCLDSSIELFALPMVLPVMLYGGQRGRRTGLLPYIFYPAHLLFLWSIGQLFLFS